MKLSRYFLVVLTLFPVMASAEIYMGLKPNDSFAQIKERFPNASFVDVKAAWLKENERFKSLTGTGINGTIYLKMSTNDDAIRNFRDRVLANIAANPNADNKVSQELADDLSIKLARDIGERLTLDWVRWVPSVGIPIQRIEAKYGKADKCDFNEETFEPYCSWKSKAIDAQVNDKKNIVFALEFNFTEAEWRTALGMPVSKKKEKK